MALVKCTQAHSWKEQIQQDRQYQQVMIGGSSVRWPLKLHIYIRINVEPVHRLQHTHLRSYICAKIKNLSKESGSRESRGAQRTEQTHIFAWHTQTILPWLSELTWLLRYSYKSHPPCPFFFHLQSFPDFAFSIHHQANSNTSSRIWSPLAGVAVLLLLRRHQVCVALSKNHTSRVSFSSA